MIKLSSLRYYVSAGIKSYEDLNFFQKIIFKFRLRRALKKDVNFTLFRENNNLPDKRFNDLLKENL